MLRSAMSLTVAMEPLTDGAIVAVCACCPALQPLSGAAAIIKQIATATQARRFSIRITPQFSFPKAIGASCDGSKSSRPELIRQAEEVFPRRWETFSDREAQSW
jgi:hypothetical protein